jgi:hypothetical protein
VGLSLSALTTSCDVYRRTAASCSSVMPRTGSAPGSLGSPGSGDGPGSSAPSASGAVRVGGADWGANGGSRALRTTQGRSAMSEKPGTLRIPGPPGPGPASLAGSSPVTHPSGGGPDQFADQGLSRIRQVAFSRQRPPDWPRPLPPGAA